MRSAYISNIIAGISAIIAITAIGLSVSQRGQDIDSSFQQRITALEADIEDAATKSDIVQLEANLDRRISRKPDLSSVEAIIDPLQRRIGEAESRVNDVSRSLESAKTELDSNLASKTTGISRSNVSATEVKGDFVASKNKWDGQPKTIRVHTSIKTCPDGWYVVGIGGIDTDGGRYCISCISDIQFICREL